MRENEIVFYNALFKQVVAINKLTQSIDCEDHLLKEKSNKISIEFVIIEKDREIENDKFFLMENTYNFIFQQITEYSIIVPDELENDTFEFDGDIQLKRISHSKIKNVYEIFLKNAYVTIRIRFKTLMKHLISSIEFIDPIEIK